MLTRACMIRGVIMDRETTFHLDIAVKAVCPEKEYGQREMVRRIIDAIYDRLELDGKPLVYVGPDRAENDAVVSSWSLNIRLDSGVVGIPVNFGESK